MLRENVTGAEAAIVAALGTELEELDHADDYAQWLALVSIRKDSAVDVYTARVILAVSDSPFVDGMDIQFTAVGDTVTIDPYFYENGPDYMGGTLGSAVDWVLRNGDLVYVQLWQPQD